jgi:beta-alanine degradation protein BauB
MLCSGIRVLRDFAPLEKPMVLRKTDNCKFGKAQQQRSRCMAEARPRATSTLQIDNDRVRVTEWRFAPGAATGWHRHGYDYVVVPMTSGRLLLEGDNGTQPSELVAGRSYARPAGVEHDVINANDYELVFVEIELKQKT